MIKLLISGLFFLLATVNSFGQSSKTAAVNGEKSLKFIKKQIASESFESVGVFDVNNDKIPDVISGAFWYEGPGYIKRNFIGLVKRVGEYW
ncbi:MAG: VCBS repeat-containing protein, partial [Segetibacter sp.]|nr:VCBS repeat-containing protein [Segetibacter sp.]